MLNATIDSGDAIDGEAVIAGVAHGTPLHIERSRGQRGHHDPVKKSRERVLDVDLSRSLAVRHDMTGAVDAYRDAEPVVQLLQQRLARPLGGHVAGGQLSIRASDILAVLPLHGNGGDIVDRLCTLSNREANDLDRAKDIGREEFAVAKDVVDDCGVVDNAVDLGAESVVACFGEAEVWLRNIPFEHGQATALKLLIEELEQNRIRSKRFAEALYRRGMGRGAHQAVESAVGRQSRGFPGR